MTRSRCFGVVAACFATALSFSLVEAQDAAPVPVTIAKLKAVGKEGQGHLEAMAAWKSLVAVGEPALPQILAGLDDASPLAGNWLRSAFETIVQNQTAAGKKIDAAVLLAFVNDTKHAGLGRRLAYETLVQLDPATKDRMAAKFLDDPGRELRRDAVEIVLKDAQVALDKNDDSAKARLEKAMIHARDLDQVQQAAKGLKKLGTSIDLTNQLGFIMRWSVAGPFENAKGVGFGAMYPPDKSVDLAGEFVGKGGVKVAWKDRKSVV